MYRKVGKKNKFQRYLHTKLTIVFHVAETFQLSCLSAGVALKVSDPGKNKSLGLGQS